MLRDDEKTAAIETDYRGAPLSQRERAICDYAVKHDVDLIVIGTHGRTGVSRLLIGSVAEKVVRHASCPVLVVPHAKRPPVQ